MHFAFCIPLGFLGLFFIYPLFSILRLSFANGLGSLINLASDGYAWRVLSFTAWQATLSTALTLALGLPAAFAFARYEFPGKSLLRAVAGVPFVMPTVVVAVAFGALLGPRGLLNEGLQELFGLPQPPIRLRSGFGLVLLAHVFYNYTVVLRLVGGFWAHLDPRLEQAAAVLGATRRRTFFTVTLPLLAPALGAAALLIFIFCFTSFGVIVILGGARMVTLEVEIYRQISQLLRLDIAASLAIVQAGCTLAMSLIYTRLAQRSAAPLDLQPRTVVARRPRSLTAWLLVVGNALVIVLLLATPLIALALRSLLAGADTAFPLTLDYYAALNENRTGSAFFATPVEALSNSLQIATATMLIALATGIPAAYFLAQSAERKVQSGGWRGIFYVLRSTLYIWADALFMLPLGTSAVTLGLGYLVAFSVPALAAWRTSPWLIPLLHSLVALPFVVRALLPVLRGRNPRLREAATTLGASAWRAWLHIELPLISPALLTGAVFAFTVSLGEFGATLLIARPDRPTLPVMIFRFLGQPGTLNYGQALAMSTILMLATAAGFLLIERIRPPGGEF